jgi:hypothetical protein
VQQFTRQQCVCLLLLQELHTYVTNSQEGESLQQLLYQVISPYYQLLSAAAAASNAA